MTELELAVEKVQILSFNSPDQNRVVSGNVHLGDNVINSGPYNCCIDYLGITFESIPDAYKYRAVHRAWPRVYYDLDNYSDYYQGTMWVPRFPLYTGNETFAQLSLYTDGFYPPLQAYYPHAAFDAGSVDPVSRSCLLTGRYVTFLRENTYLMVRLSDYEITPVINGQPSKGFYSRLNPTDFSWTVHIPDCAARDEISVSGAKFRWRVTGASSYTEIDVGTNNNITISANTFPLGQIEWQVHVDLNIGKSGESSWYTVTTADSLSTAAVIAPNNTMIDGSAPVELSWQHIISTSSEPTGADIQIKTGGDWQQHARIYSNSTTYTIPAYTFESGELSWRVRTYNSDGVPGEFSEPANVVVIAAPPIPAVYATMTGRPLISWQSSDQQAYKVEIDGDEHVGFGLDKSYRWPHFLAPGIYTVKVYIQNSYGLWSEAGTTGISVPKSSGAAINLFIIADGLRVSASWQTDGDYQQYVVFRNEVPIAVVSEQSYIDELVNGDAVYKVFGIISDDGNYVESNAVETSVRTESTYICSTDDKRWIPLPYTDQQLATATVSHSVIGTVRHFLGAAYPVAEVSAFREAEMSLDFASIDAATAKMVESLIGRQVCLKSRGEMVIGVLLDLVKTVTPFYSRYTLSLRRIHYDDEVTL